MPLQIAPVPYRGDQYLNQGITSAGQSLGEGIEGMMTRLKQAKAMRTMAVDGLGMDPDAVDKMSAAEVQGHLQGAALKNQRDEAQARRMMEQAHADYYRRFNLKADAEDRFSGAVNDYMKPKPMAPGDQGPVQQPQLDPQTLMRLEAQAGTLDPDKAMQYMKQLQDRSSNATAFDEDPVTGNRYARLDKTLIPSGIDPAKVAAGPVTSTDDDFYFDGKKWVAAKNRTMTDNDRARLAVMHDKAIDTIGTAKLGAKAYGNVAPEDEKWASDRIAHHQAAIDALQIPAAPAQTPAKAGAPKQVTPELAKQYLQQAGGDKEKARGLAKAAGYTF